MRTVSSDFQTTLVMYSSSCFLLEHGQTDTLVDATESLKAAFHDTDVDTDTDILATREEIARVRRVGEDPREDPREDVGVVECSLYSRHGDSSQAARG